ncbi:MAG: ATP-dependent helicase [Deltaproteobacteria bacterium]|nr:ATP-dependent helicase [Deltaproteobacteria bacterium]MBK8236813.1 ATP-dependent helicase [Deltaproteobacteria bacterium]MBP7290522.1 ATP-dependent helicase [Nannocystaceae bacterium]
MKYVIKSERPSKPLFDAERDLNPEQRAAVEAEPGMVLVIAGAGTGKTRTLTYRVARLVSRGTPPDRILLCTFTNRAAREMVARVEALLGLDMQRCWAGTFHHIGHRLLRRHADAVGLGTDFGIVDGEDARAILASVIAELGLKALSARRFPEPKLLHGLIGLAQGTGTPLPELVAARATNLVPQLPAILDVCARYAERKRALNVVDFDDLLVHWHTLLTAPEHAAVAEALRGEYDHVLCDEYQDVSALQGTLCEEMAARCGSLTCVGDDAQSIYSFRGADFEQIGAFRRRHPDARVLKLTVNYRSTPEVLALSNRSIARNGSGHAKELVAIKHSGMRPAVIPLRDVYQQAEFVAQRVLELHHEQNLPLSKLAVLYRNHSHSLELQVELTRRQIPYAIRSGLRFFEQAHIKDVVAYLRAHDNPRDQVAWVRLLKQWPGIGAASAEQHATALAAVHERGELPAALLRQAAAARGRAAEALTRLSTLFELLAVGDTDVGAAIRRVVESHYGEYAERSFTNADVRKEDLEHLAAYAERYGGAQEFLAELALFEGLAAENVMGAEAPDDKLVLSTIHQAKGLEWPIAFVLWLVDGRFPTAQSMRVVAELEEERRLFYVACTRAADELYLCYPTIEHGRDGPATLMRPSRFLTEIDHAPAVFDRWQISEEPAE